MLLPTALFEHTVSKPRLDSYRGYWKVNLDTAVGLYIWNGEVCGELSKLLSYLEIALRNSIHREMSLSATGGALPSIHWWDALAMQLKPEARKQVQKVRDKSPLVSLNPDEIVSRLSFGFWPNLLAWIAKQRPTLLPKILPTHRLSQRGATPNWFDLSARQQAVREFFEFNEIRNRIAHHEPLWKFGSVMDTSPPAPQPPVVVCPPSTDEVSTFARFGRLLLLYDQAIASLSLPLYAGIRTSSWRMRLDFLLSARGLDRYKQRTYVPDQDALDAPTLQRQFAAVIAQNRPVKLVGQGGEGLFIPN